MLVRSHSYHWPVVPVIGLTATAPPDVAGRLFHVRPVSVQASLIDLNTPTCGVPLSSTLVSMPKRRSLAALNVAGSVLMSNFSTDSRVLPLVPDCFTCNKPSLP